VTVFAPRVRPARLMSRFEGGDAKKCSILSGRARARPRVPGRVQRRGQLSRPADAIIEVASI
jgi:hypothetical protein